MPTTSSTNDHMHWRTALANFILVVGGFIGARCVRRPPMRLRSRVCAQAAVLVAKARPLGDAGDVVGIPGSPPELPALEGERG
jgi:hypothetical protein